MSPCTTLQWNNRDVLNTCGYYWVLIKVNNLWRVNLKMYNELCALTSVQLTNINNCPQWVTKVHTSLYLCDITWLSHDLYRIGRHGSLRSLGGVRGGVSLCLWVHRGPYRGCLVPMFHWFWQRSHLPSKGVANTHTHTLTAVHVHMFISRT